MSNALVGSGFFAKDEADFQQKWKFFSTTWKRCVGDRHVVAVDNSETNSKIGSAGKILRVIEVRKNLGHVGEHLGQHRPHLLGWSMSWILPAMVAYSEGCDFIYIEQDCLVFGDWEKSIYDDMEKHNLLAAFGRCDSNVAACEQSLFIIKHDFITEFIYKYLSFGEGDGLFLPESKFAKMADQDYRIGRFSLPGGRMRPKGLFQEKSFYIQKITADEMEQLKVLKLL